MASSIIITAQRTALLTYAVSLSVVCVVWVPRRVEPPDETRPVTVGYAPLWDLQKSPKDFILYKMWDTCIDRMANAAVDASKVQESPKAQASLDQSVEDIKSEYPELQGLKKPLKRPSDYVDPDLYKYATGDFGRLGLEILALTSLCGACLFFFMKRSI